MRMRAILKKSSPRLTDVAFGTAAILASLLLLPWIWIWVTSLPLILQKKLPTTRAISLSLFTFSFLLLLLSIYATYALRPVADHMRYQSFSAADFPYEMPAPFTQRRYSKPGAYEYSVRHGRLGLRGDNLETPLGKDQTLVAAIGCSFTYGEGVEEDATFPYRLAAESNDKLRVLNFGMRGGSVQELIALTYNLEHYLSQAGTKVTDPTLVFTTFDDHIDRFSGTGFYDWVRLEPPHVARVDKGTFSPAPETWPHRTMLFVRDSLPPPIWKLMLQVGARIYAQMKPNSAIAPAAANLYLEGIEFAEKEFRRQYPRGKFIVNSWSANSQFLAALKTLPKRIEVIHMPGVENLPVIPNDGHPSAETQSKMAKFLYEAISRSKAPRP